MKYLMYVSRDGKDKIPICFPNEFHHSDVASETDQIEGLYDYDVLSAGDFILDSKLESEDEVIITGRSESLDLDPAKGDAEIISKALREEAKD